MRVLRTTRRLPRETLILEKWDDVDGQGRPTYESGVDFDANVVLYDPSQTTKGAAYVFTEDGSRVHTPLTLYVMGDADEIPDVKDRIVRDGQGFIVMERQPVSGLRNPADEPDHYRVRCKVE